MCERVFDKIYKLHMSTMDPNNPRDRFVQALNNRMFKHESYAREVRSGFIKDVTSKVVFTAYLYGMKMLGPKPAGFDLRAHDRKFYEGLWDILCELHAPDGAKILPLTPLPDTKLYQLYNDPDITRFNIRTICDDVVTYCIFNNDKTFKKRSDVSKALTFNTQWVTKQYANNDIIPREVPVHRMLQFIFGAYRLAFRGVVEPYNGYWLEHAEYAWQRVQYNQIKQLQYAEKQHKRIMREDMGIVSKTNYIQPLGYLL